MGKKIHVVRLGELSLAQKIRAWLKIFWTDCALWTGADVYIQSVFVVLVDSFTVEYPINLFVHVYYSRFLLLGVSLFGNKSVKQILDRYR